MTVVIAGATSAIGREIARLLAARGTNLLLLARREEEAADIASDLMIRYRAHIGTGELDVRRFDRDVLMSTLKRIGDLTGFIHCVGYLGDNVLAELDRYEAARIYETNFSGSVQVLDVAAELMRTGRSRYICALSSVAGDRPRRRVRAYGVAKRELNLHLATLETRLRARGARVITVKLGPVDTRMPYGRPPQPFTVSPEEAAEGIVKAIDSGARGSVYVPARWRAIMAVIRTIPSPIYSRMDL